MDRLFVDRAGGDRKGGKLFDRQTDLSRQNQAKPSQICELREEEKAVHNKICHETNKKRLHIHCRVKNAQMAKCTPTSAQKKSKPKREVQVVACPSAFPISTKSVGKKRPREQEERNSARKQTSKKDNNLLDWHDTAKEIRAYGASAFVGKQKRDYEDEAYFKLTGRNKKREKVPLTILRGIKKAAAKREAKAREEAREAGTVVPRAQKETKKRSSAYENYGPAPNIGFMKNGVFKVQKKKK